MESFIKIFNYRQKSEKGFILIAAIMAVMIMLAVSFFILTTATQDIRISARMVGERKAISAAESGAEAVYASSTPLSAMVSNTTPTLVDSTNDPSTSYTYIVTQLTSQATSSGNDATTGSFVYNIDVTGTDSNYGSSEIISIGLTPPSSGSMTTNYLSGTGESG